MITFRVPKGEPHKAGELSQRDKQIDRISQKLWDLPDAKEWAIEIKQHRKKRTNPQNALYWKWIGIIAMETGNDPDLIHEYCKVKFLPPLTVIVNGESVDVAGSTTKLKTTEMKDYMNWVEHWALSELDIILPHPEDEVYEGWA